MYTPDQTPQPISGIPDSPPLQSAAPVTPPAPQPKRSYWAWTAAAVALTLGVVTGAVVAGSDDAPQPTQVAAAIPVVTTSIPTTLPPAEVTLLDASEVGAAVIPSVVTVQINGTAPSGGEGVLGSGSGVVYDDRGHIVTNDHVVAAGTSYEVVLSDGTVYPAELVGSDPITDLAVLAVGALDLPAIAVGDTSLLTVGDPAVAVGSPLGLDGGPSLTVGVVSAFGREVQTDSTTFLFGMLQTDAPITQGSSGGALVDDQGQLVGITTAVGVSDVGIEGIGFATPIEIVTRVVDEIIATQQASDPYIGIRGSTSFADTPDGGSSPIGVRIESVEPGTAAFDAGLAAGDVIAAVNGDDVRTMDELIALLRRYGAGTMIEVQLDAGAEVDVTLGERPDDI